MRRHALALALLLAVTTPARADKNFEAFLAGVIGAVILNAALNDEARRDPPPAAPVVVKLPPPPPPRRSPREQYLESCQAYGFSEKYCIGIWDGAPKTSN
jgi:hypothetical protein